MAIVQIVHGRGSNTIIDEKGLDWIKDEIETRLGFKIPPARAFGFSSNSDTLGWQQGDDGLQHFTLFIQNGRINNAPDCRLLDGLRAIARIHKGEFRVTPNQNLITSNIAKADRTQIGGLLRVHGLLELNRGSGLRLNAMACVAFRPVDSPWRRPSAISLTSSLRLRRF